MTFLMAVGVTVYVVDSYSIAYGYSGLIFFGLFIFANVVDRQLRGE